MNFLIEAFIHGYDRYRLQTDSTWKHVKYDSKEEPKPTDVVMTELHEAGILIGQMPGTIKIKGQEYAVNPSSMSLGDPTVHVQPVVYRITKPNQFTEAEVRSAIASGNDERSNTLTVNLEGRVKLREFNPAVVTSSFADIAVRSEAFCAGNEYVGQEAARDKSHINDSYLTLLDGWVTHLATGKMNIFQDLSPSESEEKMLIDLAGLTNHLK